MKKRIVAILTAVTMLICGSCYAASYTLPEKLEKQITYGSGISGSFRISAEGDIAETPFVKAISDAEYFIRGLVSGSDFLFSVFQSDQSEQQTSCTEIYKEENKYYFRSDMVQGKVILLPDLTDFIETLFIQKGENPSPASFITGLLTSEQDGRSTMESILLRYRNELELWLSRYITEGVFVKLEDGQSAFDSSYYIPVNDFKELIIKLISELTSDPEVSAYLDTVMTPEQKAVYMNGSLMYFYEEALNSLNLQQDVRINRRATTLGNIISTDMVLPLDQNVTGYHTLHIHNEDNYITYSLQGEKSIFVISVPDTTNVQTLKTEDRTYWISRVNLEDNIDKNYSVKVSIQKTSETHDDDEGRSHQTDNYKIIICQDNTYIPEQFDLSEITSFETIEINLKLHYYSKFAQNSSTKMEFHADCKQGNSIINIQGNLKTVNSDSWVFKPFDISHPTRIEVDKTDVLLSYITDWISNASTMIHHGLSGNDMSNDLKTTTNLESSNEPDYQNNEDQTEDAETAPLPEPGE